MKQKRGWRQITPHVLSSIAIVLGGATVIAVLTLLGLWTMDWWISTNSSAGIAVYVFFAQVFVIVGAGITLVGLGGWAFGAEGAGMVVLVGVAVLTVDGLLYGIFWLLLAYYAWGGWCWVVGAIILGCVLVGGAVYVLSEYRRNSFRRRPYRELHWNVTVNLGLAALVVIALFLIPGFLPSLFVLIAKFI